MQSSHLLLEEPIRLASILEHSKPSFFPAMTKIIGTLGPKSRSVEVIEACLKAGMSVARFDFSWGSDEYHQTTLENLKKAVKNTKKLCAVMLDTVGPELQVFNKSEKPIALEADATVIITPDTSKEASSEILPINYDIAKAVKPGDTIIVGQYLFTGSETTSVWLEVVETKDQDVVCYVKNSATLAGSLFTAHAAQVHIDLPTLTESDKEAIATWGVRNSIDFLSLSFTRHAEDVRAAREHLSKFGALNQTQLFAKIENVEGNPTLGNAIINMFGKCNKPEKSIEVFHAIKEHDAVTWNTLISVFTNQGNGGQRALFIGKRIHALIANNNIAQDVVLGTAILNMYAFLQQVMPLGANRPMCYSQASRDVTTTSVPGTNFEMGGGQVLPSDVGFMPRQALASALASAPPDQHRMMLGEQLYPLVDQIEHDHAGKVTGMLLDWKWISLRYCISLNLLMP